MKSTISKALSQSLQQEREQLHKPNLSKFDVADKVLSVQNNIKSKTIRDTFTLPEEDYVIINACRKRLLKQEISVTKSEIIRMGLKILHNMSEEEVKSSYNLIRKVKIGRPKNI